MSRLDKYRKDLASLERVRERGLPVDPFNPEEADAFVKQLETLFAPLKDKKIDSKALDKIAERWWKEYGDAQIASLKKEIQIQLRLLPLYRRLKNAGRLELDEFGLMVFRCRLGSKLFRKLIVENFINSPNLSAGVDPGHR
jgi:hypothetical protein